MPQRRPSSIYDVPRVSASFTGYLEDREKEEVRKVGEPHSHKLSCCKKMKMFFKNHWNGFFAVVVPTILGLVLLVPWEGPRDEETSSYLKCLFIVSVILYYWLTEPIPSPITSLMPIIFLPLFEILEPETVSSLYFTNGAIMIICGTMAALCIEYCGLNNKVGLLLVRCCGYRLRLLHFVTMSMTCLLSTFCQNIIITAFMCPVVASILNILGKHFKVIKIYAPNENANVLPEDRHPSKVAVGFYLGICYTVAIGGTMTFLGAGTNVEVRDAYNKEILTNLLDNHDINFNNFTAFSILPSILLFFATYVILEIRYFGLFRCKKNPKFFGILEKQKTLHFKELRQKYGHIECDEVMVGGMFVLLIIAYPLRTMGFAWGRYFSEDKMVLNSMPTVLVVVIFFALPIDLSFLRYWFGGENPLPRREIPSLVKWSFLTNRLPWEHFLIVGCASAISRAMLESRVFSKMKFLFEFLESLPKEVDIFAFVTFQFLLTQLTESSTVVALFMTILKAGQGLINYHPLYFVMPISFIANISFMLPVQTPSNLIVSGYSRTKVSDFFISGSLITIAAYFIILCCACFWTGLIFPNLPNHVYLQLNETDYI